MGSSVLRTTGRLLAPVVAVVLLAGVSLEAAAGGKGTIKLVTDNATGRARFELVDTSGTTTQVQEFSISSGTKCIVDEDRWTNTGSVNQTGVPSLVDVEAGGASGRLPNGDSGVGLFGASIGVSDGAKGTSCGRMTDSLGESLTLTSLKGAFDKLELDIEAKGSAVLELKIDDDSDKTYYLYTGTNAQYANPANGDAACDRGSDSGPDSGINDNCYWIIKDVGVSFTIKPIVFVPPDGQTKGVAGEGSLEGGGDYVGDLVTDDFSSKIHLTSLIDVGNLGCDATNNKTAEVFSSDPSTPAASCQVTRINTNGINPGTCTELIPYRLETFTASNLCTLDKIGDVTDPLAGSLRVAFKKEPRTSWDVSQTEITFTGQSNGVLLLANRCAGSVVNDPNGLRTIAQVADTSCQPGADGCSGASLVTKLKGAVLGDDFVAGDDFPVTKFLSDENDEVPNNGYIDWACVLDHTEIYVGDGSPPTAARGDEDQEISQTILFWGDIGYSRVRPD
jgi:hypothetical protein